MSNFHKTYGTEGPLGFPMLDKQAQSLDALLKSLPKTREHEYRKAAFIKAPTEVNPGERSDVSWISTEAIDRDKEVVIARGMDDAHFAMNPIVTYSHSYFAPPVGRSLWRKFVKDGDTRGIKAKTQYPPRPAALAPADDWEPDRIFGFIQAGLLNGKSIGFLPIKTHFADAKEAARNNWHEGTLVFDAWALLEYAVCAMPVNQESVVEDVSKSMIQGQDIVDALYKAVTDVRQPAPAIKFTAMDEIQRALESRLSRIDVSRLAQAVIDRKKGKI